MPAPPPTITRSEIRPSRRVNRPYGPLRSSLSPILSPLSSRVREGSIRVDLDDELQAVVRSRRTCHREGALEPGGAGEVQVDVLPRHEGQFRRLDQFEHQPAQVVRHGLDDLDLGGGLLDRDASPQHVLVEVDQLYRQVVVRVRPAQQHVPFVLLEIGQREGRVPVQFDVDAFLALQQERLAGRALAFLAAVHQHQSLAEGGVQDRLVLVGFDLDADRFKPHAVFVAHDRLPVWCRYPATRPATALAAGRV